MQEKFYWKIYSLILSLARSRNLLHSNISEKFQENSRDILHTKREGSRKSRGKIKCHNAAAGKSSCVWNKNFLHFSYRSHPAVLLRNCKEKSREPPPPTRQLIISTFPVSCRGCRDSSKVACFLRQRNQTSHQPNLNLVSRFIEIYSFEEKK